MCTERYRSGHIHGDKQGTIKVPLCARESQPARALRSYHGKPDAVHSRVLDEARWHTTLSQVHLLGKKNTNTDSATPATRDMKACSGCHASSAVRQKTGAHRGLEGSRRPSRGAAGEAMGSARPHLPSLPHTAIPTKSWLVSARTEVTAGLPTPRAAWQCKGTKPSSCKLTVNVLENPFSHASLTLIRCSGLQKLQH